MASDRANPPPQQIMLLSQKPVQTGTAVTPSSPMGPSKKTAPTGRSGTRRLGVDNQGQYYYKNTPSSTLMASLQLGLQHSVGSIAPKPRRDILMTDFEVVETADFPSAGSDCTPAHKYRDFTFKTYSPEAFRFFRQAFGIEPDDFLVAMCDRPLRELSNPGASGSLFYLSADDAFIMKTVQKKEARFLQKLLPGYYLNMTQNKRTLLPKFFGLYRYKSGSVNIRIVVMNNLLPSGVIYHEKFDLKGSTYKRKASGGEQKKKSPTFKDLDFMEKHEEGIVLAPENYEALVYSVQRDCKVLESFGIMDYSLLLGVHNIDQAIRDKAEASQTVSAVDQTVLITDIPIPSRIELSKNFSIISAEDIPSLLEEEQQQRHHYPEGYIQGRIHGDRVMFYLGVIDILQSYRLKKKLEHGFKSVITDGATVSVHNPTFYARRFQEFMTTQVFKKDKVKYKTRKNSTNAQLRGRRLAATAGRAATGDRHGAAESRTSPLTELPTYNQAMKGSGLEPGVRVRSKSAIVPNSSSVPVHKHRVAVATFSETGQATSSGGVRSTETSLATSVSKATSDESRNTGEAGGIPEAQETSAPTLTMESLGTSEQEPSSSEGVSSDPTIARAKQNVARADEQIRTSQNQSKAVGNTSPVVVQAVAADSRKIGEDLTEADGPKESENIETEFARNVRGTSTPMNPSPAHSPSQSKTFNTSSSSEVNSSEAVAGSPKTIENSRGSGELRRLERKSAVEYDS